MTFCCSGNSVPVSNGSFFAASENELQPTKEAPSGGWIAFYSLGQVSFGQSTWLEWGKLAEFSDGDALEFALKGETRAPSNQIGELAISRTSWFGWFVVPELRFCLALHSR